MMYIYKMTAAPKTHRPATTLLALAALAVVAAGCGTCAERKDAAAVSDTISGTFTDPRDAKTYRTVKIGKQTWMAENLNFKTGRYMCCEKFSDPCYDYEACYGADDDNCRKYGRLYNWETAMQACPAGWRLPSVADWDSLARSVGGHRHKKGVWKVNNKKLKSKDGWIDGGNGTDDYGFSALPGGFGGGSGHFRGIGTEAVWWSAEEDDADYANSRGIDHKDTMLIRWNGYKMYLQSVRCVKDSAQTADTIPAATTIYNGDGTFTDGRDGRRYRMVSIGDFTWMAENLNFDTGKSWCYGSEEGSCEKYGRVYDWNTAMKACPAGWSLPGSDAWDNLGQAAGGKWMPLTGKGPTSYWSGAGKKLMSKTGWGKTWDGRSGNGIDEFGFSAIPAGTVYPGENNVRLDATAGRWWTSDEYSCTHARFRKISGNEMYSDGHHKSAGYSVRCVQDSAASR